LRQIRNQLRNDRFEWRREANLCAVRLTQEEKNWGRRRFFWLTDALMGDGLEGEGIPPHTSRAKRSPDSSGFLCFLCALRVNLSPPRQALSPCAYLRQTAAICAYLHFRFMHDSVLGSLGSFDSRHSPLDSFSGVTLRSVTNTLRVTLRNSKSFGFTELVTLVSFFVPPPHHLSHSLVALSFFVLFATSVQLSTLQNLEFRNTL